MILLAAFAVLIVGFQSVAGSKGSEPMSKGSGPKASTYSKGLQADDNIFGCDPANDPCFECFACTEDGRCAHVDGCVAACQSDDDCVRIESCIDSVCQSANGAPPNAPNPPVDGGDDAALEPMPKEPESKGTANAMGECKYDGTLGVDIGDGSSKIYQSECMKLSMAECAIGGAHNVCTYVAAEGSAIGCIWDGTGCEVGCIASNMEQRCGTFSHDQEACSGEDGQNMRCKWSKAGVNPMGLGQGANIPMPDGAESVGMPPKSDGAEFAGMPPKSDGAESVGFGDRARESAESMGYPGMMGGDGPMANPEGAESVGMAEGAESQGLEESAEAEVAVEGEGTSLFDAVGLFNMESNVSTRDMLLVALLTVSGLIGLYQLYRWCVNWKLRREYKLVNTSDRATRSSHCIIDGKAYF